MKDCQQLTKEQAPCKNVHLQDTTLFPFSLKEIYRKEWYGHWEQMITQKPFWTGWCLNTDKLQDKKKSTYVMQIHCNPPLMITKLLAVKHLTYERVYILPTSRSWPQLSLKCRLTLHNVHNSAQKAGACERLKTWNDYNTAKQDCFSNVSRLDHPGTSNIEICQQKSQLPQIKFI